MTKTQFTPGPWSIWGENLDCEIEVVSDQTKETICIVLPQPEGEYSGTSQADARLIAAAPELYEALRCAKDMLHAVAGDLEDGYSLSDIRGKYVMALINARDDAWAALAKARGETP